MLKYLILNRKKTIDPSTEKGFTLIEVIAVLVLIGILLAYVFFRTTSNNNLQTEVDLFKSHLRYAQYIALCGDNTYTWRITTTANNYVFSRETVAPVASLHMSLPGETFDTHTFARGVTITAGGGTINFDQWGSPGVNNITITLSQGGVSAPNIIITRNTGFIQ